jgi:plastocyanin
MHSRARLHTRVIPLLLALVAGMSVVVLAASPSPAASPAAATTHTVHIVEFSFSPPTVTVNVGDTVKWLHDGTATMHSVTADNGSFDSSPNCPPTCLGANATFSHTFTKAGTFRYYCRIHGAPGGVGMSGTVIVKSSAPAPTITKVVPAAVKHGTKNDKLTITGTNFATGIKVKVSGTGVTVSAVHRTDAGHLTVTVSVTAAAAKTKRNVTVTNPSGAAVTKAAALTVT